MGRGDTLSPKLFTAALRWIMKSLGCDEKGIREVERFLSDLGFVDRHRTLDMRHEQSEQSAHASHENKNIKTK